MRPCAARVAQRVGVGSGSRRRCGSEERQGFLRLEASAGNGTVNFHSFGIPPGPRQQGARVCGLAPMRDGMQP